MHSKATHTSPASTLAVLVGGEGRRMGGVAKGDLPSRSPGETLLDRTVRVAREAGFSRVALVGRREKLRAYERYTLETVIDRPDVEGPLAGLSALCSSEREPFVMVACDMPELDPAVLARLREGHGTAAVLAPRDARSLRWEPTLAWYHPARVGPALERAVASGTRSFQAAFSTMECVEFVLTDRERATLEDWDTPEDRAR
ncbi:MAG: molybdenum cofactor guanylyltransferase [Polyangiales bacterium]